MAMSFKPALNSFAISALMLTGSASAFADGFICEGLTFGTKIEVYNKLKAAEGTRNVSVMIVSQPSDVAGDQTIAKFSQGQKILIQKGATYIATVDGRYKGVQNQDKKIADTTLSELSTIELIVEFNYRVDTPSQKGQKFAGTANYLKENGSRISENMTCIRYKKH